MLRGKAKTDYMRDYMQRKRAGLITRKEPKERKPSQRKGNRPRRHSGPVVFCAICGDARMPEGSIFVEWDYQEPICEKCADKASELVAKARRALTEEP